MPKPGVDPTSGISSGMTWYCPSGIRHVGGAKHNQAFCAERENLLLDAKGEATSGSSREGDSTAAERRGGAARSSDESPVMGLKRRGCVVQPSALAN
jgi:hypothetical protein